MFNMIPNILILIMLINLMLYFHRMFLHFDKKFKAMDEMIIKFMREQQGMLETQIRITEAMQRVIDNLSSSK